MRGSRCELRRCSIVAAQRFNGSKARVWFAIQLAGPPARKCCNIVLGAYVQFPIPFVTCACACARAGAS
eukprot:7662938-Alexandrium_andersonii.AAC.1